MLSENKYLYQENDQKKFQKKKKIGVIIQLKVTFYYKLSKSVIKLRYFYIMGSNTWDKNILICKTNALNHLTTSPKNFNFFIWIKVLLKKKYIYWNNLIYLKIKWKSFIFNNIKNSLK